LVPKTVLLLAMWNWANVLNNCKRYVNTCVFLWIFVFLNWVLIFVQDEVLLYHVYDMRLYYLPPRQRKVFYIFMCQLQRVPVKPSNVSEHLEGFLHIRQLFENVSMTTFVFFMRTQPVSIKYKVPVLIFSHTYLLQHFPFPTQSSHFHWLIDYLLNSRSLFGGNIA
jgi:hypothetical protein